MIVRRPQFGSVIFLALVALAALPFPARAAEPSREALDFFESKVRPVLAQHCYECHGAATAKAGLRLDSRIGWQRGGQSGPALVPGDPDNSLLLQAVRHADPMLAMPKDKPKLADDVIAALDQWVRTGAADPRDAEPAVAGPGSPAGKVAGITDEHRAFWSFQPIKKVDPPQVKDAAWPRGAIDQFVLAKLEEKNLPPSPAADKLRLLRRLTFDLTGLPPAPEAIAAFQADISADAVAKVVDGLLASPEFGERWGRHWLDVTYWAESSAVGRRSPLRDAWRYRDYVIDAFNADKPFDQFVKEQLAGDTMGGRRDGAADLKTQADRITATGFLALGPWPLFNQDRLQVQADIIDLQVDLVGRTFLGMTVGCARCHDHMFDPIPTRDYYALAGIFRSTQVIDPKGGGLTAYNRTVFPADAEALRRYTDERAAWEALIADLKVKQETAGKRKAEVQQRLAYLGGQKPTQVVPMTPAGSAAAPPVAVATEEERKAEIARLEAEVRTLDGQVGAWKHKQGFHELLPPLQPGAFAAAEHEFPENARVNLRGSPRALGEEVPRGFLQIISTESTPRELRRSGRRELAEWIASRDNPLTARVYVNRLWHHLFGRGIVASVDNFGTRGDLPTHPELLDFLATRLIENEWSTKKTIREIVLSRTYQQSSDFRADAQTIDPDNKLLWRMAPRRLEAEAIRDGVLAASGRLDRTRGGPTLPLTEKNLFQIEPAFIEDQAEVSDEIFYRRAVYLPVLRGSQLDAFDILPLFDFADPDQVVGARSTTTVSLQSLFLMNSPFMKTEAKRLAERVMTEAAPDDAARIERMHLLALGRPATPEDVEQAKAFLASFQAALDGSASQSSQPPGVEAWSRYAHALLGSAEFLYRG